MSPLIVALFIQELQTNYTIHFHVRTLSPVKRRRKILLEPLHTSPKSQVTKSLSSSPHILCPPIHPPRPSPRRQVHPHQASPSFMKSTVNTPSRNNRNILGPIPKKVQGRGSSFFYSHHLPSGIPLESQNHKFQVKPLESSLQPFQETVHPVWVSTYLELRPGRGPPALLDLA